MPWIDYLLIFVPSLTLTVLGFDWAKRKVRRYLKNKNK